MKVGYHSAKFGGHCGFSLSRDLARPRSQRVMLIYRQEPIKVSYHPAKFGGHRHFGSGDMFLVCHVILT